MKIYKIKTDDVFYGGKLTLIINCTNEEMLDYIQRKHKIRLPYCNASASHSKIYSDNGDYRYIWIDKFNWTTVDQALLAHEIFHYVHGVLRDAGLVLSNDSEEAYAYLLGRTIEVVWKKLKHLNPYAKKTKDRKQKAA